MQSTPTIRFCHVIDSSTPNPLLFNSLKYSDRAKFQYSIISLGPEAGLREQMAEIGVSSRSFNYTSRRQAVSAFGRLYRAFTRDGIQIVQSHLFDASLIGLTAARAARVPVTIFTGHHSHETPLHNRRWLNFLDGASSRFLARHTIAPSQQMKEILIRDLGVPENKIQVLHHGFDLEKWRLKATENPEVRRELGIEGKVVFGAVGRLFWVKNFENLIRAFKSVAEEHKDIVLLIVGGGESQGLQALINSLDLGSKVILTGPREDIASVMSSIDVLVHPSLAESFGMVFIEALVLGKPIITTKVGIAPEIIVDGQNGFLIDEPKQDSIVSGMQKMLNAKSKWPDMGANGMVTANSFEVTRTQAACDQLYEKWLERASGATD